MSCSHFVSYSSEPGFANRGWGGVMPYPPGDRQKNHLTFLFKAFSAKFSLIISYTL